jgi:acetyl-CoA acetyltransferase
MMVICSLRVVWSRCRVRRSSPRSRASRFRVVIGCCMTRRSAGASRTPRLEERFPLETMGETGENVAERWSVSREEQDAFALRSQQRWAAAAEAGRFDEELVPVGEVARDEHPRPDTSAGNLASLKPAFRQGGSVTAGNSSGLNDGAAAVAIASEEKARELGGRAAGCVCRLGGRGCRSARDGDRAGARCAQGARTHRHPHRRA